MVASRSASGLAARNKPYFLHSVPYRGERNLGALAKRHLLIRGGRKGRPRHGASGGFPICYGNAMPVAYGCGYQRTHRAACTMDLAHGNWI